MKVLVVDDSVVFRSAISSAFTSVSGIEVFKSVPNGKLAVDAILNYPEIDLITLDMEMPVMDGIQAIKEIRQFNKKVIIIVFSSFTQKGAEKTIEALNSGANDFVTKPENISDHTKSFESISKELMPKVLEFKNRHSYKLDKVSNEVPLKKQVGLQKSYFADLILIGCSTGGPEVLTKIFQGLQQPIQSSILIVQHMPPLFTTKLAEMLNRISAINVVEATHGMKIQPNTCYIAPGDYHMIVENKTIHLNQNEKVCFVRPSVDVLFQSVARLNNTKTVALILTGMGEDGAVGSKKLKEVGCEIYFQDKESSVVWGMPGSVQKSIPDAHVVELNDLSNIILKYGKS